MDDRIGLVFSWDPRAKAWVKERGPDDAAAPPAPPRDPGAVQTYFLDPQTGRWHGTILGGRARQISFELGSAYRAPYAQGLDIAEGPRTTLAPKPIPKASRAPLVAGLVAVGVLVIGGVVASQTLLAPAAAVATPTPGISASGTAPTPAGTSVANVSATPGPSVSASPAASASPTATATPTRAPVVTARPTQAPAPTTITTSVALPDGFRAFYIGPNAVQQGSSFTATIQILKADGSGATSQYVFFLGAISGGSTTASPDGTGRYQVALRANTAPGQQGVNMLFGTFGTQRIATIEVR